MRLKVFIYTFVVVIVISLIQGFSSYETYKSMYLDESKRQLDVKISEVERFIDKYKIGSLEQFYQKNYYRVTIIDSTGKVLFDSEADKNKMENHLNREEIINASHQTGKVFYAIRKSKTLNHYFLYAAKQIKTESGHMFIRTSVLLDKISVILNRVLKQTVKLCLISIIIGLIFTIAVSNILNKPIKNLIKLMENELSKFSLSKNEDQSELKLISLNFSKLYQLLEQKIGEINKLNQQLNILLNSIDLGIVFFDSKRRIVASNSKSEELFETKIKKGTSLLENIRVYELYEFLMDQSNDQAEMDIYINGKLRTLKLSKKFIKYEEVLDEGVILIIDDITRLKKLEKIRADFVANVSHELKTPLTSIKGFIETLNEGAIEDISVSRKFLNIIEVEVERLTRLINDLLYLSEIENISLMKNDEPVNISEVLIQTVELLSNKARQKNVKVEIECSDDLYLNINKDWLKQIFLNLIDNAIMYNKEYGYVNVSVIKAFNKIQIKVKDSGIGIPNEEIERIFERFYRVDKGRSRKLGGTGLGLSIVKHIVQLYNGKIEVKSEVGVGSEFTVYL